MRFVGDQDEQYIDAVYQRFDGKRNYVCNQKEELVAMLCLDHKLIHGLLFIYFILFCLETADEVF